MAVKNKKKFSLGRRRTKFELSLGLTPAACWLFYYIVNPRLRKSKGEWTYLNITHLSRRKGAPCRRALQYAVNVLDAAQEPLGVKIRAYQHNGKPCHLIFCDITWNQAIESDQEPLFFTSEGHSRNLKYRCHSNKVLQQPHCADIAPLSNSSSLSNERSSSLSAFAENFQSTDSALPHRKEENLV